MKQKYLARARRYTGLVIAGVLGQDDISQEKKLCADKTSGELFRLQAGKDNCRDVIQCTAAVRELFLVDKTDIA